MFAYSLATPFSISLKKTSMLHERLANTTFDYSHTTPSVRLGRARARAYQDSGALLAFTLLLYWTLLGLSFKKQQGSLGACSSQRYHCPWTLLKAIGALDTILVPMKHGHSLMLAMSVSGTYQTRIRARHMSDTYQTRIRARHMSDTVQAVSSLDCPVLGLDTDLTRVGRG